MLSQCTSVFSFLKYQSQYKTPEIKSSKGMADSEKRSMIDLAKKYLGWKEQEKWEMRKQERNFFSINSVRMGCLLAPKRP